MNEREYMKVEMNSDLTKNRPDPPDKKGFWWDGERWNHYDISKEPTSKHAMIDNLLPIDSPNTDMV